MNDKELLELAAKAAGIKHNKGDYANGLDTRKGWWNPLTDDGDALRLAVKLGLSDGAGLVLYFADADDKSVVMRNVEGSIEVLEVVESDPYAATRHAIVRAAAEMWRTK